MTTAQQVIDIAKSQVGFREGFSNGHWNNIQKYSGEVPGLEWSNGQAWCDVFVCWVFTKAGLTNFPVYAFTGYSTRDWKAKGRWSEYPAIGAQVMFGANGGNVHTGIVIAYDADTITCIEGNTNINGSPEGDGVYVKVHQRRDAYVYGYGYPEYEEGIQSADPAWGAQAPAAPAPAPSAPVVSLSRLLAAISHDGPAAQGATSYPADVRPVEQALASRGFLNAALSEDGSAGTSSFGPGSAYQRWQLHCGFTGTRKGQAADGYPGMQTLTRLGQETGRFVAVG